MFVFYSFMTLCRPLQDATLTHYSGYTEEEIQPVFKLMVDYLHRPVLHEAFFKKYASKKFLKGISTRPSSSKHLLTRCLASILTRQWAKKYHPLYLDPQTTTYPYGSLNTHNNKG